MTRVTKSISLLISWPSRPVPMGGENKEEKYMKQTYTTKQLHKISGKRYDGLKSYIRSLDLPEPRSKTAPYLVFSVFNFCTIKLGATYCNSDRLSSNEVE
jgi:hypothetical protein